MLAAPSGSSKADLRAKRSNIELFEPLVTRGENPFIPALMHALDRYLQNRDDVSEFDRIVRHQLDAHPKLTRSIVEGWLKRWRSLPTELRARVTPPELRSLTSSESMDMTAFRSSLARFVRLNRKSSMAISRSAGPVVSAILPMEPDGAVYLRPGETTTVRGSGLWAEQGVTSIVILKRLQGALGTPLNEGVQGADALAGVTVEVARVAPSMHSPTQLTAVVPQISAGHYLLLVERNLDHRIATSNTVQVSIAAPLPPAPTITTLSPANVRPGKTVVIIGSNFDRNSYVDLEAIGVDGGPAPAGRNLYARVVHYVSPTRLEFTLPVELWPGNYQLAVWKLDGGRGNWKSLVVDSYRYKVRFTRVRCIDETNPEWAGSDELVIAWLSNVDHGRAAWRKNTADHGDYDEGETATLRPEWQYVVRPNGSAERVDGELEVGTVVWEWDMGDVATAQDAVDFVGDILSSVLPGASIVAGFFGELIQFLWGDPDHLGTTVEAWTAPQLQTRTQNADRRYSHWVTVGSGDGVYKLMCHIYRIDS